MGRPVGILVALLSVAALGVVHPAFAGGPSLSVGVVDDSVAQPTLAGTTARLRLVREVGFDTIGVTEQWTLDEAVPPGSDVVRVRRVVAAAKRLGMHVVLSVYPSGSAQTPLGAAAVDRFAGFTTALVRAVGVREVTIGNEPNLNRFWMPQFTPDGSDAAAPAYLALLARAYDALKALDPGIVVDGGAVSPHGGDRAGGRRPTHSPTAFITDLGAAYRASGRNSPVMDAFDLHPYDASSSAPPTITHPSSTTITIADYPKLVTLLGRAFDGTTQPGSTLPIVYGEFGVQTVIPPAEAAAYTGAEQPTVKPVDATTQGLYYREAISLAFCQPNVRRLLLFHAFDEPDLAGWQSGVYYADGTAKPSLPIVRKAIGEMRRGVIARCPGLSLTPEVTRVAWPHGSLVSGLPLSVRLECSIDCVYRATLERIGSARPVRVLRGRLVGGSATRLTLLARAVPGRFRLRLSLTAPVDPGPPRVVVGPPFTVRS